MKTELKELRGEIEAKRSELSEIFSEAGPERDMGAVKSIKGDTSAKVDHIRSINDELGELTTKAAPLEAEEATLTKASKYADELSQVDESPVLPQGVKGGSEPQVKSLGQYFGEEYVGKKGQEVQIAGDVDGFGLKTLFQTSAGWGPQNINTGRLVLSAQKPVQVIDLVPAASAGAGNAVGYWKEVTFTNAAEGIKEGGEYKESALKVEEATAPVKKIGTYLPITDEQLEDVAQAQAYVNNRLVTMVQLQLDEQILTGEGSEGELTGFLKTEGIQEEAKGEDTTSAAILRALTKVRTGNGQANPTAVFINPADWQQIRLERTEDGVYLWGPPSEAGPMTVFGVPVYPVQAMTEGTALTGDFAVHSALAMKKGVNVKVSDSHSDYFIKGKQAIRADVRAALVVYRPAAFVQVTGI